MNGQRRPPRNVPSAQPTLSVSLRSAFRGTPRAKFEDAIVKVIEVMHLPLNVIDVIAGLEI